MAIFHFSGIIISRSKGRSAVASAASRSEEKLYDERLGCLARLNCNEGIFFKEVLLPSNAPLWMSDREKLWNAVEKSEKRKDSQLAREFHFSLPRELNKEQNIELAKEFVKNEFVFIGMIVDLCLHTGKTKDENDQPHAHVMLTMRDVNENGFGLKNRSWDARENVMLWRESWAEHLNKHLALNGIDQRVDHRSLAELDIDLIPQKRLGLEHLKIYRYRKEEYDRTVKENGNRILNDPTIALKIIVQKQTSFTDYDLVRIIKRYTVDEQFNAVYEKVKSSKYIISLGIGKNGKERFGVDFQK